MPRLSTIIFHKTETLGENYQHLGSAQGPFWSQKKTLISYQKGKGFHLVTLNLFQLFLRKVFGCYSSTHLSHVCTAIDRFKLRKFALKGEKLQKNNAFEKRMKDLWSKTYPNKSYPTLVKSQFAVLGNVSSLDEAELICFADQHSAKTCSRIFGDIINHYYMPGDEISIEGVQAGTRVKKRSGRAHQLKYVNPQFPVEGLEPPGYEKIIDAVFEKTDKKYDELNKLWEEFRHGIPKGSKYTEQQIDEAEDKAKIFLKQLRPFYDYFYPAKKSQSQFQKDENWVRNILNKIRKKEFQNDANVFEYTMIHLVTNIEKQQHYARYAHITTRESELAMAGDKVRNASLCETIERHCNGKRRMFVIMGALHLLRATIGKGAHSIQDVKSTLHKRKFAIVAGRKFMKRYKVEKFNPDLHIVRLPAALGG